MKWACWKYRWSCGSRWYFVQYSFFIVVSPGGQILASRQSRESQVVIGTWYLVRSQKLVRVRTKTAVYSVVVRLQEETNVPVITQEVYGRHVQQTGHQPGKVANPARDQLNRENKYFPVPVRAWEFGLARQVRLSRPASAGSFSKTTGWIRCSHTGSSPSSRFPRRHPYISPIVIGSVPRLSGQALVYRWRWPPRVQGQIQSSRVLRITL